MKLSIKDAVKLVTMLAVVLAAWFSLSGRVTELETKQHDPERLARIEQKIDDIDNRTKRIERVMDK